MSLAKRAGLIAALLLGGCAGSPEFDSGGVDRSLTPREAIALETPAATRVLWGGLLLASENLARGTRLEVLAYPLDGEGRPQTGQGPRGRFLIRSPQYLETLDYAQGRLITVTGGIDEIVTGTVGEAPYSYPVVIPDRLHLWPREGGGGFEPRFHIGVGVLFGN